MRIVLSSVQLRAGAFSFAADDFFSEGVHMISGRIGSGKSTLGSALAGLSEIESGKIILEGCGSPILLMQFPEYQVTGPTVVREISSWGVPRGDPTFSSLDVEISDRDPFTLSRGELKRLMLACVFSKDPDVLILDEPYASLDISAKEVLTGMIENRRGITIVFSHETEYAPNHAVWWKIESGGLHRE
ncbi:ABC transporter related protein [Methanocorpusculum labreanum Z]|uniref:ABC transporter related protein n=1 Tax=Methanocorpusculum labreanum (strain ATCC 43576 / DSM 4855 / Z) TaxID=410358 RepID=A2SPQ5_METLZ|nr:ATP-binding cassette domain-containing protein [Methanocorpusculum labreanum]ABN06311.1 ABC transporter related protein [Methanocorpusculum labreanum Z]